MSAIPEIRWARDGDAHIGYQVFGSGPDLLLMRGWTHLEIMWEHPLVAEFLEGLASFSHVIIFDPPGAGVSDPVPDRTAFSPEHIDPTPILNTVGVDVVSVLGFGLMAMPCIRFAAEHPDRVSSLTLVNGMAKYLTTDDYPWGISQAQNEAIVTAVDEGRWLAVASGPDDPLAPGWRRKLARASISPGEVRNRFIDARTWDARRFLSNVACPTLCLSTKEGATHDQVGAGEHLAETIPDARHHVIETTGDAFVMHFRDPKLVIDEIQRHVTGTEPSVAAERVLATVLFTDIVDSTASAAELGDASWKRALDTLDRIVAAHATRAGGRVVKGTGDGHLLTFPAPSPAIAASFAIRDAARDELDLRLRTGVHFGEVELRGVDVAGMAVVIASRVCDLAGPNQILVSPAVPPLVAGSGVTFDEHGTHELKGVPGRWTLYEAAPPR